jgi:hypothetical protein
VLRSIEVDADVVLPNRGALEKAHQMPVTIAGTTKLYDRSSDMLTFDEIEHHHAAKNALGLKDIEDRAHNHPVSDARTTRRPTLKSAGVKGWQLPSDSQADVVR